MVCVACSIYVWALAVPSDQSSCMAPNCAAHYGETSPPRQACMLLCVDILKTKLHSAVKHEPYTRRKGEQLGEEGEKEREKENTQS